MRQLRPYQQDLLSRVQHALADHPKGRLMLQLPTGGGKTVIGGALLAHWLIDNRKALWLTHRKELAERTRGMLTDAGLSARTNIRWTLGTDAPAIAGGGVILMAQTVGRRTDKHRVWNRYNLASVFLSRWRRTRCQRFRAACWVRLSARLAWECLMYRSRSSRFTSLSVRTAI